ncbi:MAG: ribosome maturation factor RimM [Mariprofundaceae bacterium]|nr:ribosome maturation factor RimM [Mariprofundaceae bacterium]
MQSFLYLGDIHDVHGLKGLMVVYSHTRELEAIAGYSTWWLGMESNTAQPYTVMRCWKHGKRLLVELENVQDINMAEKLKGQKVFIPKDEIIINEDEYLWQDLVDCVVYDGEDALGKVASLQCFGAQDVLCIHTLDGADQKGEWLIPFIEDIVQDVDLDGRRIDISLPEGMEACFTLK